MIPDLSILILSLSVVFQLVAAAGALRLIPLTGRKRAWSLIAAALVVMAVRRVFTLVRVFTGVPLTPADLIEEAVEVTISILLLAGVGWIGPVFRSVKANLEARVEAERGYRRLFEHANDVIFIFEPEGETILEANPKAAEVYGVPLDKLVGESLRSFTCDIPKGEAQVRAILEEGGFRNFETKHQTPDGRLLNFLVNSSRITYRGRTAILSINRDVTERGAMEDALRESEARYRTLVEEAPDPILVHDGDKLVFANAAGTRLLGALDSEDLVGKPVIPLVAAGFRDAVRARNRLVIESGQRVPLMRQRYHRLDGTMVDVESTAGPVLFKGAPCVQVVMRDVTAQVQAERALSASEKRYRLLFERNQAAIFRTGLDGRVLECNDAFAHLLGYRSPKEAKTGRTTDIYVDPSEREHLIRRLKVERSIKGAELHFQRGDGTSVWVIENVALVMDEEGGESLEGTFVDVTARKRAEEDRQEAEERFRATFDQAAVGIAQVSPDGSWLRVNDRLCDIVGYSRDELLGLTFHDITHPADLETDLQLMEQVLSGEIQTYSMEKRYIRKDGATIWINLTVSLVRETSGAPKYFIKVMEDISNRKRTEAALKESEAQYRAIFEGVAEGIYRSTPDGRVMMANPALVHMLGYESLEALLHRDIEKEGYSDPCERARYQEAMKRDGLVRDFVSQWRKTDGSVMHVIENARVVRDAEGRIVAYEGTVRDITERKKSLEQLQLLSTTIEQAHEGVVVTDPRGTIQYVNPAIQRMSGYTRDELVGQSPRILKSGRHDEAFYRTLWETITCGQVWSGQVTNRRKDGILYVEDMVISPVKDSSGAIAAFVATKRDVTKEVEMQRRLQQAKKLETIGMIAGGVAHEVRNPLFAISTIVAALERKLDSQPEFGEYVIHIQDQTTRLTQLMEDLLSLGRPVDPEQFAPCGVGALLRETLNHISESAPSSHRRFAVKMPEQDLEVSGISGKLVQVLLNIFQNALAFSPDGKPVRIQARREDGHAVIACTDSGPGIPEPLMDKLFEPFASKRKGGTGLGLAIVQKIVEAHGGVVEAANNDPPPGATFTVRLPLVSKEPGGGS